MRNIIVSGIGVDVGKTTTSAILMQLLEADYWKPIQAGHLEKSDAFTVRSLSSSPGICHPELYRLNHPVSPHHAANLDGIFISSQDISVPHTERTLIIEMCGGLMVPINEEDLLCDVFAKWNAEWILVSRHYLGSINHTLLSLEMLHRRNVHLKGIIFNGQPYPEGEKNILKRANAPLIGRIFPEPEIHSKTIEKYAYLWSSSF